MIVNNKTIVHRIITPLVASSSLTHGLTKQRINNHTKCTLEPNIFLHFVPIQSM